ncbi:unnamed protein product, partial [Laminaria digitata]
QFAHGLNTGGGGGGGDGQAAVPAVTAALPAVTTAVPAVTATVPAVTPAVPGVTAMVPGVTAVVPAATAAVPVTATGAGAAAFPGAGLPGGVGGPRAERTHERLPDGLAEIRERPRKAPRRGERA